VLADFDRYEYHYKGTDAEPLGDDMLNLGAPQR
jgi:hypothetical protein